MNKFCQDMYKELQEMIEHHQEDEQQFLEKYHNLFKNAVWEERRDKSMIIVYCLISILVGAAVGFGLGYLKWGRQVEPPAPPSPPSPSKPTISKKDALKVMELIECLYEIDQVE